MITVTIEMEMVMWEVQKMKDRKKDPNSGEWKDTGEEIEKTRYTMRDEFGQVLKFLAGNEYRDMERSLCNVSIGLEYNDYQSKNTMKLENITQVA